MAGKPSIAKIFRDAGGIRTRICPATSNLPTRMTSGSWKALCKATIKKQTEQQRSANGYNGKVADVSKRLNFCRECNGKILPPGLELIPMEEMMATKLSKGVCSACHQRGIVSKAFSAFDPMCNTCAPAFTAVNTRPEVVAQAIIGFGVVDKMLQLLAPAIDQQQLLALVGDNLPESVRQMATAGSDQNESSDALQRIITALGCECEDHADSVDCVLDAIKVHTQTLDRYREQLEFATQREHDIRTVLECDDAEEPTFTVAERRMAVLRRLDEIYNVTDDQRIELDKQVSTLTAENNRLAQLLEDQNDALACAISGASEYTELSSYTMNPEREALADFGLRVLAGRVRLEVV